MNSPPSKELKAEKYEIIKFYESIVHKGRGVKEETTKKFNLASLSTLNTILENKEETIRKLKCFR
jgi:hypothetical protein